LVVSGGHTTLFYARSFTTIDTLGATRDDACGEAFDKVAKLLGLGYPGGPLIERAARQGNPSRNQFKCSGTENTFDFSFSGIKTAVLYYLRKHGYSDRRRTKIPRTLVCDIAASFQEAVFQALAQKALAACLAKRSKQLIVGGGVALNVRLRQKFAAVFGRHGIACFFPPKDLCMDNAAMIAGYGYQVYTSKRHA
jgi:N6-L-threonylcarbamoyladenine synthase